ncbi:MULTISPECIES: hypothetical protein [Flavobacterium]|uniref:Uncharacterized protein n=1 Tax=Flavobacterium okayamense TaxID=2830782 RepID=A0ABM7S712_9FLAO|nr:hypothetical protein [Flavobacterium okayamense]BCY29410.1 hypothetical protein KK2020170_22780 [Flavobacterium okayamense]
MIDRTTLLSLISCLELRHTIEEHELSIMENYLWIETGIREEYPLTFHQLKTWNKLNNYLVIKANTTLDREAELWGKGFRGRTHIEIANAEIWEQIQLEIGPLELFFDENVFTFEDLNISFIKNETETNRLKPTYIETTEADIFEEMSNYLLPNDDDLDDYDLDNNPMIESKS